MAKLILLGSNASKDLSYFCYQFVDGSVAGTELSTLANYQDTDYTHEHTYFGNGNGPGQNLTTVGDSYQTSTYDGETQKIGTYYNFQAATVGTGAELAQLNDQAPDTFCPNGWQLPIGNNQAINKSFQKLLDGYSITNANASSASSYPLSLLYSGGYRWDNESLFYQGVYGWYRNNSIAGQGNAFNLRISSGSIQANDTGNKGNGFPLRCVSTY